MNKKNLPDLTLASSLENIDQLLPFLKKIQEILQFSDDKLATVRLALNEAVMNAIIHGNKQDPAKNVEIMPSQEQSQLRINVRDEGSGFDPSALPDPRQGDKLLKQSGRGLFLIKQHVDRLEFGHGASEIIMYFSLDD